MPGFAIEEEGSNSSRAQTCQTVLSQHADLVTQMSALRSDARGVLAGVEGAVRSLRARLDGACASFSRHLAFEDAALAPLVERASVRAAEHLERMRADHARQRELIASIAPHRARAMAADELANRSLAFASFLEADMIDEERLLLSVQPNLLMPDEAIG